MSLADIAPFVVVFLVGAVAGRLVAGRLAWSVPLSVPVLHLAVSLLTRRAEQFFPYVLPINIVLLVIAVVGLLAGRWMRGPRLAGRM